MTKEEFKNKYKIREGEDSSLSSSKRVSMADRYRQEKMASAMGEYSKGAEAIRNIAGGWNSPAQLNYNEAIARDAGRKMNAARFTYGVDTYDDLLKDYSKGVAGIDSARSLYGNYLNQDAYDKAKVRMDLDAKYSGASYEAIQKALRNATDQTEREYLQGYTNYSSLEDFDKAIAANGSKELEDARGNFEVMHASNKYKNLMNNKDFSAVTSDDTLEDQIKAFEGSKMLPSGDKGGMLQRMFGETVTYDKIRDEDVKEIAKYIFATDKTPDKTAYKDFMKDVSLEVANAYSQEGEKGWADWTDKNFATGAVGTAVNLAGEVMGDLGVGAQKLVQGKNFNPYTGFAGANRIFNASEAALSQSVSDVLPALGTVYEAVTEGLKNRLEQQAALAFAPVFGGAVVNAIIGSSVYAQSYGDALREGYSPEQATEKAVVEGFIEFATESVGMPGAFGKKKEWWQTLIHQFTSEGNEEVLSSIANLLYDNARNKDKSEFNQNVQKYIEMGYDPSEAESIARKDWIEDVVHQYLVAGLSAGMTGAVSIPVTAAEGSRVDVESMKKAMENFDPESDAYKRYVDLTKDNTDLSEASNWQKGALYQEAMQEAGMALSKAERRIRFRGLSEENVDAYNKAAESYRDVGISKKVKLPDEFKIGSENVDKEGNNIDIADVETEDGKTVITTNDGQKISLSDAVLTENTAYIVRTALKIDDDNIRKLYIDNYKGGSTIQYDTNVELILDDAYNKVDSQKMLSDIDTNVISESGALAIYNAARERNATVAKAQESANTKAISLFDGQFKKKGTFDVSSLDMKSLTKSEKAIVKFLQIFSHMGMNIRVIKDSNNENGWVTGDNAITINLAARYYAEIGKEAAGKYVIPTMAHESTHWMENILGDEFELFKDLIRDHIGTEKWNRLMAIEGIRDKESKTIKDENGNEKITEPLMTKKQIESEVVARFCEDMLSDMTVADRLFQNASASTIERLVNAVKRWFATIRQALKDLMEGYESNSEAAKMARALEKEFKTIQDAWVNMFERALALNQTLDKADVEIIDNIAYNRKTLQESPYGASTKAEFDKAGALLASELGVSEAEGKRFVKNLHTIAAIETQNKYLQYIDTGLSAWVSNSDYGGNFDFSYLCPKRLVYTGTLNAIRKRLKKPMTPTEFLAVRRFLIRNGYEAPCSYCYVESSRLGMDKAIQEKFLNVKENKKYGLTLAQLTDADFLENLRQEWITTGKDNGFEAFEKAMNKMGQRKPKALEKRRAYRGEIRNNSKLTPDEVERINRNRGLRFFAFSDLEVPHILDLMQIITDMSVKKLAGFAYTKQVALAEVFGGTGLKINLSCVAKGIDENGNIIFDDVEGMNGADAVRLRKTYSQNVGIVCVVFTDEQLKAALADSRIDYVLPFHRSNFSSKQYAMMGLPQNTKDFTKEQTEKQGDETTKKTEANIPVSAFWVDELSGRENAQRYLDIINENGLTPLFRSVLEYEGGEETLTKKGKHKAYKGGKWVLPKGKVGDGYYKLLIEQKMYDNSGKPAPQTAVMPNFNMLKAIEITAKYKTDVNTFPVANNVVDEFMKWHKDGEKAFSKRVALNNVERIAKEHFGTTDNFRVTGYILLDGSKLDFSGAHDLDKNFYSAEYIKEWKRKNDLRQVDHEDIYEAYEKAGMDYSGDNRLRFIEQGNIRVLPEYGGLDMSGSVEPTDAQYSVIKDYVYDYIDKYTSGLEIELEGVAKVIRYSNKTSPTRIINDLKAYYHDGIVPEGTKTPGAYSFSKRVTDKDLIKKLDNDKHYTVYRTFQIIDGGLYSPMQNIDYSLDENNRKVNKKLGYESKLGVWEEATESLDTAIKNMQIGKKAMVNDRKAYNYGREYAQFDLEADDNTVGAVAYNPYLHSSNLMLNDQLSASHRRNLVVVECEVPAGEDNGAYWADYAKDSTGWHDWRKGVVASALAKEKPEFARKLYLSRYLKPIRIVPASEVAQKYKEYLDGVQVPVKVDGKVAGYGIPWNVVTQDLRRELEKLNVPIYYGNIFYGSSKGKKIYKSFSDLYPDTKYSKRVDLNKTNPVSFKGKEFWSGSVSLLDGKIEEVHTYEEAERAGFHHSLYFSDEQVEKLDSDDNAFFFVNNGKIETWRDDIPQWVIGRIYEQLDSKGEKSVQYSKRVDSDGNSLTDEQIAFYGDSQARDSEGRLLRLYHGTPTAGFTVFDTSRGRRGKLIWLTTSLDDAKSYGGTDRIFDPNEKQVNKETAGTDQYMIGKHFRFDSAEDKADFLKRYPIAEKYMTPWEIKDALENADEDEAERLEDLEDEIQNSGIESAYEKYETSAGEFKTIKYILDHSDDYGVRDFARAFYALDSNSDPYYDYDEYSDDDFREVLLDTLRDTYEESKGTEEDIGNIKVKVRIPVGTTSVSEDMTNIHNRVYSLYANIKNPIVIECHGKNIANNTGVYEAAEKLANDKEHDGIIARNVRVGAHGHIGDVVLARYSNQVKLTTNLNPSESTDIQYSRRVDSDGTELTEDQMTFFSDSQARDSEGRLLVLYHGSSSRDRFNVFELRPMVHGRIRGEGFYFTPYEQMAQMWGKTSNVYKCYLNLKNPYIIDGDNEAPGKITEVIKQNAGKTYERFKDEIVGGKPWWGAKYTKEEWIEESTKDVQSADTAFIRLGENATETLKSLGYDGVIYKNGGAADEYVAFYPNQIKVTTNLNPTESDDIRYSQRVSSDAYNLLGLDNKLQKDNEILEADIKRLKKLLSLQGKVTMGTVLDDKKIKTVADVILREAKSTYDRQETFNALSRIYDRFNQRIRGLSNEPLSEVWDECYDLASKIMDKAKPEKISDSYYKGILADIRSARVKLSDSQKKELKYFYGNDWHSAFFGKVITANDGRSLDSYWSEWASMYPDVFDESTTPNDQPTALLDIYDSLKESSEILQYFNDSESIMAMAEEIYSKFWNVPTLETVADKYTDEIKKLRFEHRKAMDNLRDSRDEAVQKVRNSKNEIIKSIKEDSKHRLAQYKMYRDWQEAERKTEAEKNAYVKRITDSAMTLAEWLNKPDPKKGKYVPEALKKPIADLVSAIDYSSKRALGLTGGTYADQPTGKDRAIADALAKIKRFADDNDKEGIYYGINEELAQDIEALSQSVEEIAERSEGLTLNMMSRENLQRLNKIMTAIRTSVRNVNKRLGSQWQGDISDLAIPNIRSNEALGAKKNNKYTEGIKAFFEWQNTTPIYAFEHLGEEWAEMFHEMMEGHAKFAFHAKLIKDYANDTYTAKQSKKWRTTIHDFDIVSEPTEEEAENGGKAVKHHIKLSEAQIMSLYCLAQREQGQRHIYNGGIRIADIRETGVPLIQQTDNVRLSPEDVARITNSLFDKDPDAKKAADKLMEFMNTTCSKWMNEVTMKRWGIEMATEEFYFPIKVDATDLNETGEPKDRPKTIFSLLNMGFTKAINENANNPVVIDSILDVFTNHSTDMAKYNALALPVLDMHRLYNFKVKEDDGTVLNMKKSIETAYGTDAMGYITQFLLDLNGSSDNTKDEGKIMKLTKRSKVAAVAGNLQVAALQPVAITRAKMYLSSKYLAKGAARIKEGEKEMLKYSGMAVWKDLSLFDTNISRGLKSQIAKDETVLDKAVDFTMKGAEKMDSFTWGALWSACKAEQYDKGLRGDDLIHATVERFENIVYHTQVVDSIMTRSQLMRHKSGLMQMVTAFMSEPTISMNLLQDAAVRYAQDVRRYGKAEAFKRNGKHVAKCVYIYGLNAAVESIFRTLMGKYRDWDEEPEDMLKALWKEFLENINPMSNIPIGRDIVSAMNGYNVERMDMASITSLVRASQSIMKVLKDEKDLDYKTIYRSLQALSQLTGIPLSSLMRDGVAAWNDTVGNFYPNLKIE